MPGNRGSPGSIGQGRGPVPPQAFYVPYKQPSRYTLTGITRDSTGAVLGNCVVILFETATNLIRAVTLSDANGAYLLDGTIDVTYYVVAYRSGSPDVAGTTVNTLVATPA